MLPQPLTHQAVLDFTLNLGRGRSETAHNRLAEFAADLGGDAATRGHFVRMRTDVGPLDDGSMIRAGDAFQVRFGADGAPQFAAVVPREEFDRRYVPIDPDGSPILGADGSGDRRVLFENDAGQFRRPGHAHAEMDRLMFVSRDAANVALREAVARGDDFDAAKLCERAAELAREQAPGITAEYSDIRVSIGHRMASVLAEPEMARQFAQRPPETRATFVKGWAAYCANEMIGDRKMDETSIKNIAHNLAAPKLPLGSRDPLKVNPALEAAVTAAMVHRQAHIADNAQGSLVARPDGTTLRYNRDGALETMENAVSGLCKAFGAALAHLAKSLYELASGLFSGRSPSR